MAAERGLLSSVAPDHGQGLGGAHGRDGRHLPARPGGGQPRRRRALAPLGVRGAGGDVPLEPGPADLATRCWCSTPLAMGVTLIATGEHYFFDVAARVALRRPGDVRLAPLGTASAQESASPALSASIASTGERVDPRLRRRGRRETRSPSITPHSRRSTRVVPTRSPGARPWRRSLRSRRRSARSDASRADAGRSPRS